MALSKPFVVATEGPTVDGRNISRDWLVQMAKNYSTKTYTAVANLEHYLSSLPDGIFKAYGKVVSLSTQEAEIMGEKKLQLMAVVDASDELVALQKKGQKAFASMEVINNFIGKGVAYLSGLAFTDKPASIGTESIKFSTVGAEGERYGFDQAIEIEFEAEETPGETLFTKVKTLLGLGKKEADERFADITQAVEALAQSQKELLDQFATVNAEKAKEWETPLADAIKPLTEAHAKLTADFAALQTKLGTTDGDGQQRTPATGGDGTIKTDC